MRLDVSDGPAEVLLGLKTQHLKVPGSWQLKYIEDNCDYNVSILSFTVSIVLLFFFFFLPEMLHLKMLLSVDDDTLGWAGTINVP